MDESTANKPQKIIGGKGKMNGTQTGPAFSSTYQPTPEAKSKGQQKKKLLKDILSAALDPNGEHAKMIVACAAYMEKEPTEITLADLMHFRIAQKAVQKQDVFAYQAVMDRAFGKPENKTTLANDENNPITPLSSDQVNNLLSEIRKANENKPGPME